MRLVLLFSRIAFDLLRFGHYVRPVPTAARLHPLEHDGHLPSASARLLSFANFAQFGSIDRLSQFVEDLGGEAG
jgi:hypothetical protein